MKIISLIACLSLCCWQANATESDEARNWLNRLSSSLQQLNFSTSFVVVKNNQAEPYHWYHGIDPEGSEYEILALLNGPRRDTLRKDNIVSYLEPEFPPYSVTAARISGPIPKVFSSDISALDASYDFISVGKSRILGRMAQIIRVVPKDQNRYGHWLWLDSDSGLLLKMALITRNGQLLEQVQFTHLDITEQPADSLQQLATAELPHVVDLPQSLSSTEFAWQVNWLPQGFKQVKADRHRILATKQPVEFMMFNDGLIDISVYVGLSKQKQRDVEFVKDGATVVLNQVSITTCTPNFLIVPF